MKQKVLSIRNLGVAFSLMACLSACSNVENIEQNDGQPVEIKLSSGVTPESRALTPTQSTQIESGETVYVWAENSGTTTAYFNAWALTSDGSGKLNSGESDKKYFPTDRSALNIYALHGNFIVSDEMYVVRLASLAHVFRPDAGLDFADVCLAQVEHAEP